MHFHLTQEQRIELSLLMRLGSSQRAAAAVLGVSPSTVCRELKRNTSPSGRYHARAARLLVSVRRRTANQRLRKLLGNVELETTVAGKSGGKAQPCASVLKPSTTGCTNFGETCLSTCAHRSDTTAAPERIHSGAHNVLRSLPLVVLTTGQQVPSDEVAMATGKAIPW